MRSSKATTNPNQLHFVGFSIRKALFKSNHRALFNLTFCISIICFSTHASAEIREDFASLDKWQTLTFDNIPQQSKYLIKIDESGDRYLSMQSQGGGSGLIYKEKFNPYDLPILSWEWVVFKGIDGVDHFTKEGDDYPIRVYVLFEFDPDGASYMNRLKYSTIKAIKGEYPPDSSLNYVWTTSEISKLEFRSPYTSRAAMIVLRDKSAKLGLWQFERVNILDDYRRIFKKDPPRVATLAIMSDSDATGQSTSAGLRNLKIREN